MLVKIALVVTSLVNLAIGVQHVFTADGGIPDLTNGKIKASEISENPLLRHLVGLVGIWHLYALFVKVYAFKGSAAEQMHAVRNDVSLWGMGLYLQFAFPPFGAGQPHNPIGLGLCGGMLALNLAAALFGGQAAADEKKTK